MSPAAARQCANCKAGVRDKFCPNCGQEVFKSGSPDASSGWMEFFEELTSISGKLIKSVIVLLFAPGLLARWFARGKTVNVVSPMKLYLLSFGIFVFVISKIMNIEDLLSSADVEQYV